MFDYTDILAHWQDYPSFESTITILTNPAGRARWTTPTRP